MFRPAVLVCALLVAGAPSAAAQPGGGEAPRENIERTGEQIYKAACVSCHGPDGKGQPVAVLGFQPPDTFPDFTDCPVSSVEPDDMWRAVLHRGGRVRGLSHIMPAFGEALTDAEIDRVVQYLHSLCAEPRWPRGNLNFPRAFFTEKAFPENEAVFTFSFSPSHPKTMEPRVDYEHRLGRRAQYEIGVPFTFEETTTGQWNRAIGDVNLAYKYALYDNVKTGTIVSAGGELTIATERELGEPGHGQTVAEAFAMFGQALPRDAFLQVHAGFERPADLAVEPKSVYWRTAFGKTIKQNRWGRLWTPMVELLAARELAPGAEIEWDVVPQMQVSLSVFQHIRLSVGVRVPITGRDTRTTAVMTYLLWDWFDGGLFELWRAH